MKHLKSRKHHSKGFRKQAVELLLTGKTFSELAQEIGVNPSTLIRWRDEYLADMAELPADTMEMPPHKMLQELQRLRKENDKLKLHQEILKKAMGILSGSAAQRYALITLMAQQYHLRDVCWALRVPRSSYYAWRKRPPSARQQQNQLLQAKLTNLFVFHRKVYGSPRMTACLNRAGVPCSRNRVARHMRDLGLKARQKRSFKPKTTDSKHPHPIARNLLTQAGHPKSTNRIWVSDITYIHTAQGWLYLAAVMDLYSRKVVGWATADHLKTSLVEQAMLEAVRSRRPAKGLLHHSDRGCQYASADYRQLLSSLKALPSMSSAGNCYDNAAMESFWSTLKTEWLHHRKFQTHAQAKLAIFDYIETFYNPKRLHSALGYQSPVDFENQRTT